MISIVKQPGFNTCKCEKCFAVMKFQYMDMRLNQGWGDSPYYIQCLICKHSISIDKFVENDE